MSDLPRDVGKVLNARASDAIAAIFDAVERGDRAGLNQAAWDLVWVLEDEQAAQREAKR